MRFQRTFKFVLAAAALFTLDACATSRQFGVLTEPLPPYRELKTGNTVVPKQPLPAFGNRQPGEMQVDMVGLLSQDLGASATAIISDTKDPEAQFTKLSTLVGRETEDRRRAIRNDLVGQLMAASEANCDAYLLSLRGSQVASRTFFDITTSLLGVAGGIASPARSAQTLSAAAAFSNSAGSAVDRDIFAQMGVELVAKQIDHDREQIRTTLINKMAESYDAWPVDAARTEVIAFHSKCSMVKGLASIDNAVQTRDVSLIAARNVAARVFDAKGSAAQVAAAVEGVTEAGLTNNLALPTPPPAQAALPPVPAAVGWSADMDDMREVALACLEQARVQATGLKADASFTDVLGQDLFKTGACSGTDKTSWSLRSLVLLNDQLTTQAAQIDKARAADKATPPAPKTPSQLDTTFAALSAALADRLSGESQIVVRGRASTADAAVTVAQNTGAGDKTSKVEDRANATIKAINDTANAANRPSGLTDPVLANMMAAANALKATATTAPADSKTIAQITVTVGQTTLANYKPLPRP